MLFFLVVSCGSTVSKEKDNFTKISEVKETIIHESSDSNSDDLTVNDFIDSQSYTDAETDTTSEPEALSSPDIKNGVTPINNTDYLKTALNMINMAKNTIYICHFEFNDDNTVNQIKNYLFNAHQRGVKIRIILDDSLEQNKIAIQKLNSGGINDIKLDSENITTHVKLIITDNQYVLLGSTNLSYMSIKYNNETNALVNNEQIANFFSAYFDKLWYHPYYYPQISEPNVYQIKPIID